VRLTHRVLDLRRETMQKNLMLRYRVAMAVRKHLHAQGFIDIETPMLTRSTPEGARDYLVPSRVHPGEFFALPQSPQLFKQLLMIAGFDRYYQITKCFRDEDLRADRQPEFTQIDCETSFLDEREIRAIFEGMIRTVFKEVVEVALPDPFPVMSYADAMCDYGSDKPDLRVPLKLTELTEVMKSVEFKVFSGPATSPGHRVAGLLVPKGGELTRGEIDAYGEFVGVYGAKGLAWIKFNDVSKGRDGMQSPIVKNLSDAARGSTSRSACARSISPASSCCLACTTRRVAPSDCAHRVANSTSCKPCSLSSDHTSTLRQLRMLCTASGTSAAPLISTRSDSPSTAIAASCNAPRTTSSELRTACCKPACRIHSLRRRSWMR